MKRTAIALWNGDVKSGKGDISTQSTVLNKSPYSFNTRFADGVGTNPEELLGAAHAGCFTMAVSAVLTQQGIVAGDLNTRAIVELNPAEQKIAGITLELTAAKIDGVSEQQFNEAAQIAKANCPLSKALAATPITLTVVYQ
jgi:osmotically inducible protein OsmC